MKVLVGDDWRSYDFTGQSVGVLAPMELAAWIVPTVVGSARSVKVFQEQPAWVLPLPVPVVRTRLARLNLRVSVKDAWTRRLLTPSRFAGRDVVVSPAYYRALQQQHCKLVAWPVYAVVDQGVRTAEGIEHRVDVLVTTHRFRQELAA